MGDEQRLHQAAADRPSLSDDVKTLIQRHAFAGGVLVAFDVDAETGSVTIVAGSSRATFLPHMQDLAEKIGVRIQNGEFDPDPPNQLPKTPADYAAAWMTRLYADARVAGIDRPRLTMIVASMLGTMIGTHFRPADRSRIVQDSAAVMSSACRAAGGASPNRHWH
jgi:hypothetical protein